MSDRYSATIQWSDEDGCYIAFVPEIEGLSAFGETPAEAIEELEVAKELLLSSLAEKGVKLPQPDKISNYSGQVRLRMLRSLHMKLAEAARRDKVSLNTFMVALLSEKNESHSWQKAMEANSQKIVEALTSEHATSSVFSNLDPEAAKQHSKKINFGPH